MGNSVSSKALSHSDSDVIRVSNGGNLSPNNSKSGGRKLSRKYSQIFQRRRSSAKKQGACSGDIGSCPSLNRLKQILTYYYKWIEEQSTDYQPRYSLLSQSSVAIPTGHDAQNMSVSMPANLLELTTNMSLPALQAPQLTAMTIEEILSNDAERKENMMNINKGKKLGIYEYVNNKFEKGTYSNCSLLNDFNHCLVEHDKNDDDDFEYIYNNLISLICKECDINSCLMIRRNYRNRINLGNDTNIDKRKDIYFGLDCKEINIQQILDKIHCFYYHSYDMGFKLNTNIKLMRWDGDNINNDNKKHEKHEKQNTVDIYQFLQSVNNEENGGLDENKEIDDYNNNKKKDLKQDAKDRKLLSLRDILQQKKRNYIFVRSSSRFKSSPNRYFSDISDEFNNNNNPRYYYWNYYKDKEDDDRYNDGYKYKNWYIPSRYFDLKEELINNTLCAISINQFNDLMERSTDYLSTEIIKKLLCNVSIWEQSYLIKIGDLISIQHIISIILYTSFDNLRREFVSTFYYKSSKNENRKSLIKRHCQFANFGRLLRESIECYGIQTKNSKINRFFHGITHNVSINDISVIIKCPFSTSSSEQTILNYYDNGLLLKLNGDFSGYSTYFDCNLLSDFVNEYEILFIGGLWPLIYENVIDMKSGYILKIYLYAMHVIDNMLNGVYYQLDQENVNETNWKLIQQIVIKLIHHQLYRINNINNNNNDDNKEEKDNSSDDNEDEEEEEEDFIDEEEEIAKRQKIQMIARRPSSKAFKRSSFKPPSRALPALPVELQNNLKNKDKHNDNESDDSDLSESEDKIKKKEKKKKKKNNKINKYKEFKGIPIYIESMLNKYCKNLIDIKLDYMRMNKEKSKSMPNYRGYKFCGDMFCLYKIEWFKFPVIMQLFPNLESMEIWGNIELCPKILDYILVILVTEINKIIKKNKNINNEEAMKLLKLKTIKIDEPEQETMSIRKAIKKYKNKFKKIAWKMYEDDDQLIMTSIETENHH